MMYFRKKMKNKEGTEEKTVANKFETSDMPVDPTDKSTDNLNCLLQ